MVMIGEAHSLLIKGDQANILQDTPLSTNTLSLNYLIPGCCGGVGAQ